MPRLPDRVIVGKKHTSRVEVLQPIDPVAIADRSTGVGIFPTSTPGEVLGAVVERRVDCLAGEDDRAVGSPDCNRLMASGMTRRREDEGVGKNLGLAIELLVIRAGEVDRLRHRVVLGRAGGPQLNRLDEDRTASEGWVTAAMIEVKVTVRDPAHVLELYP